jgi:aspartate 1-decarboxylase
VLLRHYIAAKIHGVAVTDASVDYHGSVAIGCDLLRASGIEPYEQVHVVNLNTGDRWVTYAIPGPDGVFTLNGGGARLGVVGDRCVVMTYGMSNRFEGAPVVYCEPDNTFTVARYRQDGTACPPVAEGSSV